MRKHKKALTILLSFCIPLLFLCVSQGLPQDDITEDFDESLDILSQTSEKITTDLLSMKNFQCLETITIDEFDKKKSVTQHHVYSCEYEVTRKIKPKSAEHIGYTESRLPGSIDTPQPDLTGFPLIEKPFTGEVMRAFTIENRICNDYKKLREETVAGHKCLVFAFQTVKEISTLSIILQGTSLPFRQQGLMWVDEKAQEIVRLNAKLKKLPKGMQSYDYSVEFKPLRLFGRSMALPEQIEIKTESKEKKIQIVQRYADFREKQ
jgi:hypothetical protein